MAAINDPLPRVGYGMVVPLLTPFLENGEIDCPALPRLCGRIAQAGLEGVFALGTTGESARLNAAEKALVLRAASAARGKCRLYIGISGAGTKNVLESVASAAAYRPDALVCTLPYYFQAATAYEQRAFFSAVLDASPVPVLLYNMPGNVGCAILPQTVLALCAHPAFGGVKDSGGDWAYFDALLAMGREKGFPVLQGVEGLAVRSLRAGAAGLVPSQANAFPRLFAALRDAAAADDWEQARRCQEVMDNVNRVHKQLPGKMAVITCRKELLRILGLGAPYVCAPSEPLPEALAAELEAAAAQAAAFERALSAQ